MKTISQLIEELNRFPSSWYCFAYEGEGIGIILIDNEDDDNREWIDLYPKGGKRGETDD